jgi:transposase
LKRLPAPGRLLALDETTLRHLPPLRAAWALRGQQAEVPISGQNARRTLFATVDLRTGRRVVMVSRRQRLKDYHGFLRRLRTGAGAKGALWLLLDRHSSHQSPSSLRLAAALNITLVWLPRQCPRLNPVDHLWRGLKNDLAANRQFASIDEQARYAENWVRTLESPSNLAQSWLTLQALLAQESAQNIVATYLARLWPFSNLATGE